MTGRSLTRLPRDGSLPHEEHLRVIGRTAAELGGIPPSSAPLLPDSGHTRVRVVLSPGSVSAGGDPPHPTLSPPQNGGGGEFFVGLAAPPPGAGDLAPPPPPRLLLFSRGGVGGGRGAGGARGSPVPVGAFRP